MAMIRKDLVVLMVLLVSIFYQNIAVGQTPQVHNDAPIRLRVWFNGVWGDANCSEVLYPSLWGLVDDNIKYVFENLQVRAANGNSFPGDLFPSPQVLFGYFPVNMTFSIKDNKMARFYSPTDSRFKMLNPWYPYRAGAMNWPTQQVVPKLTSKYDPPVLGQTYPNVSGPTLGGPNLMGIDASNGDNFLLFDRTYNQKAPDRFQWKLDGAWESDADFSESEAGFIACASAFGLPQVAERRKFDNNLGPELSLLIIDSLGLSFLTEFTLRVGGCGDLFGVIDLGSGGILGLIKDFLLTDFDDSWVAKRNWEVDEAFFRGTPPGQIGYFATDKLKATNAADRDYVGEGYMLLFSYQWDWATTGGTQVYDEINPETPPVKIQAPLCPTEVYTDAHPTSPIRVEAWVDGLFQDNDHEGYEYLNLDFGIFEFQLDLGFAYCSDIDLPGMSSWLGGEEEIRIRGKAWVPQQGEGEPGWNPTIEWTQDYPDWHFISSAHPGAKILDRSYGSESGMRSFDFRLEAWEADSPNDGPGGSTSSLCVVGTNSRCCAVNNPFGGGCVIPGYRSTGRNSDNSVTMTSPIKINWRNSPPNKDNYYYVPMRVVNQERRSYIARIKYKWQIDTPKVISTEAPFDRMLCPGEQDTLRAVAHNATFYQWQYVEMNDPAGPDCPAIPESDWINVTGANCPSYIIPDFTNTRIYRMVAFNRNGEGSKGPDGDKFAKAYSRCIRIQRLPQTIPMVSPLECGTAASPTLVRSGSSYNFTPALPPDSGSVDIAGIVYNWTVSPSSASVTPSSGELVTVKFPPVGGVPTTVTMTSDFSPLCGVPNLTRSVSCYFITEDGGCDTLTGVIYVTNNPAASGGIGSITNPFSLGRAFQYLRGDSRIKHVKMLAGTYNISQAASPNIHQIDSALILTEGLVVEGGYVERTASDGTLIWVKKSNERSIINSTINERINDSTIHRIGFRSVNVNNWTIQDITINTGDAPLRDVDVYGHGHGLSNYGILISGSSGYRLHNVTANAGAAGQGGIGETPSFNNPPDVVGFDLRTFPAPPGTSDGPGDPEVMDGYVAGLASPPNNYRKSGRGGRLADDWGLGYGSGANAQSYTPNSFGYGGIYNHPDPALRNGYDGISGGNSPAVGGEVVFSDLGGMFPYFRPITRSGGSTGSPGGGGGGGAAASATAHGGAGGIGGRGGLPGYSGGGAFSIWIVNGSTGVHNNVEALNNTVAGARGVGGEGEEGQAGGGSTVGGYSGGKGGTGGRGASGGLGYAMSMYQNASTNTVETTDPLVNYLESDYSAGCTNSVFEVTNSNGATGWSGIGNPVYDIADDGITQKGTTLSPTSPSKLIYYTLPLGPKDIGTTGIYHNQIYVRYNREAPTTDVPTRICSGTPISLASEPNSQFATEYEWVIQPGNAAAIVSATSPAPILTYTTQNVSVVNLPPNTTGVPVYYQVKYRVKDACCGWSIPIYKYVEVISEITNVVGEADTVFICNEGTAGPFSNTVGAGNTTPPSVRYQWFRSLNGSPFDTIVGATNAVLPVQSYTSADTNSVYRYIRVVGSTTVTCMDSSNIITVIVQPNFTNNLIADPLPITCNIKSVSITAPVTNNSTGANPNAVDIGFMSGSTPLGPGGQYTYQWQYGRREIASGDTVIRFQNYPTNAPFDGGNSSATKDFDPGVGATNTLQYGTANQIFMTHPDQGEIYFRRIVGLPGVTTACKDTSDYVTAYIPYGVTPWGTCALNSPFPTTPFNARANLNNCRTFIENTTGNTLANLVSNDILGSGVGGPGKCLILAPDTVCFGEVVHLNVPNTQGRTHVRGRANVYAWYAVDGGPYNNNTSTGTSAINPNTAHFCLMGNTCTHPLLRTNCSNDKPHADSTQFLGTYNIVNDTLGNNLGMTLQQVMIETKTFYVSIFDDCFTDANFRADTTTANRYYTNSLNLWQRKTVIVREPVYVPDSITATPNRYCTDMPPAQIELRIHGGYLGNAGYFEIYAEDTINASYRVFTSAQSDTNATGRTFIITVPPTSTTKYFARAYNTCDTTDFVEVEVIVDQELPVPTDLDGAATICEGESLTLTVSSNDVLPAGAEWVLYRTALLPVSNRISSNLTGEFTVSPPNGVSNYIVRAEYTDDANTCLESDTVMHTVDVRTDCVCDDRPGVIEYAQTGQLTIATIECEGSDGWTYYANALEPEVYLFAIQKIPGSPGGNTLPFNAVCSLYVTPNPTSVTNVFYDEDVSVCEANFVMPRYWNVKFVNNTGDSTYIPLNGFIRTRFYFPPSELDATRAAATAWQLAHHHTTCGVPLNVGPDQVFKTTDATHFSPNVSFGKVVPPTDIQPTTINDFRYVGHLFSSLPHGDTYPQTQMNRNYIQVAWDGFSGGGVAIRVSPDIAVLPVTIVSFTGTLVEDEVLLNWQTASELNNDYFIVEKSSDTKQWTAIGSVKGNGTTTVPHLYSLIDGRPLEGENYYRLKQVDFDGTVHYSRIIVVMKGTGTKNNMFSIHPNPTAGPVVATIVSQQDIQVNILISDITGRRMGDKSVLLGKGENNIKIDLSNYPGGTYVLSYTDASGDVQQARVVKQ